MQPKADRHIKRDSSWYLREKGQNTNINSFQVSLKKQPQKLRWLGEVAFMLFGKGIHSGSVIDNMSLRKPKKTLRQQQTSKREENSVIGGCVSLRRAVAHRDG